MTDDRAFAAVARRAVPEGRLLRWWPLEGGVSASMHALEIGGSDGEVRRLVVRRIDIDRVKEQVDVGDDHLRDRTSPTTSSS